MTAKERDTQIDHWQNRIETMEQECCKYVRLCGAGEVPQSKKCSDLRQQIHYAEWVIEKIREEWRQSKLQPT